MQLSNPDRTALDLRVPIEGDPVISSLDPTLFTKYCVADAATEVVQEALGSDPMVREGLVLLGDYDEKTRDHVVGVALLAAHLGLKDNMMPAHLCILARASLLHDVGKSTVDVSIINPVRGDGAVIARNGNDNRWEAIKRHPQEGYRMVQDMYGRNGLDDELAKRLVPQLVLTHHCHDAARETYPTTAELTAMHNRGELDMSDLQRADLQDLVHFLALADKYEAITALRAYTGKAGFEDPSKVLDALEESHPNMDRQIQELMLGIHLSRFPLFGWMENPYITVEPIDIAEPTVDVTAEIVTATSA